MTDGDVRVLDSGENGTHPAGDDAAPLEPPEPPEPIELTEAASTRPAKQPIRAVMTYCRTMMGREGMPVTRAA